MKWGLILIICSLEAGQCMDPYEYPKNFKDSYDCVQYGYEESFRKIEEIGRKEVNEHSIFIKFSCNKIKVV
jgi:hypothetical protein|tara:strand:+ start:899 stop:1111 length:213 start_codon:yes stop_codon:yes gene_type:complete